MIKKLRRKSKNLKPLSCKLMLASNYFKERITENNYNPSPLGDEIILDEDFNCDTYWKPGKEKIRKIGVEEFLKGIRRNVSKIDLLQTKVDFILSDKEFGANLEQSILEIQGETLEEFKIYTSNIVGSFFYNDHQLNINCRFGNQFLQYMIANTSGFIELENLGGINRGKGLGEWMLILYWKMHLKRAFSQGLYKNYKAKKEAISTIRGSIDINELLKKNYFDGKTTCNFKEHSYDNYINRTIQRAITKLARGGHSDMLSDILDIKRTFDSIHFSGKSDRSSNEKVTNPFYRKYNQVVELSEKILRDEFLNFTNPQSDFSAFVFDVSLLFEFHIRKVIKKKFQLHEKDRKEFKIPNGINDNHIFPDVIIQHSDNEISIYDVKYKNFITKGPNHGVAREDRFQLTSYLAYYSSRYKIRSCGFIYPCREEEFSELIHSINSEQSIDIGQESIPFRVYFYKVNRDMAKQYEFDKCFVKSFNG